MKRLVSLWGVLATELGTLCGTDASRDILTVSRRCEKEGDAFLRITLPAFQKGFEQALEEGRMSSSLISGFHFSGGLPVFLQGFLRNIFTSDGALLDIPCIESIRSVRQLTAFYGKIEGRCTPRRENAAIAEYVQADDDCAAWDLHVQSSILEELQNVAQVVLGPWISEVDHQVATDDLQPRHGPGQTADRLLGNEKYDVVYWPEHLESRFPWVEWGVVNYRYADSHDRSFSSSAHVVTRARQTLVPKTMSRPRVIVMEPTALQYMQQALMTALTDAIERSTSLIGFTDQEPNRSLARRGSLDRSLSTIDLSEASDRVTYLQAASVLSVFPNLWEALDATRSSEVDLANNLGSRDIAKFASMGSAVCFPVEAMVFCVAIFMAIQRHHRKTDAAFRLRPSDVRKYEGLVRVYGDDLIIPVEYLSEVRSVFSLLGWKINERKSFSEGNFRESCGGDYWRGEDVTPIRCRNLIPTSLRQTDEVQSLVSLRNQLYLAGYWTTASYLDDRLDKLLRGRFPIVGETSAALGRVSVSFSPLVRGTDRYQRALTRAYSVRTRIPKNACSETGALLKCLLPPRQEEQLQLKHLAGPARDSQHLHRSGRPEDRKSVV